MVTSCRFKGLSFLWFKISTHVSATLPCLPFPRLISLNLDDDTLDLLLDFFVLFPSPSLFAGNRTGSWPRSCSIGSIWSRPWLATVFFMDSPYILMFDSSTSWEKIVDKNSVANLIYSHTGLCLPSSMSFELPRRTESLFLFDMGILWEWCCGDVRCRRSLTATHLLHIVFVLVDFCDGVLEMKSVRADILCSSFPPYFFLFSIFFRFWCQCQCCRPVGLMSLFQMYNP